MDDDALVPMEEESGEFEDTYEVATAPASDGLGSVLVVLTSIFLLLSIGMILSRLHTTYDMFKSDDVIKKKLRTIERGR